MIPLRIVVRTDTPWATMTVDQFVNQKSPKTPYEFIRIGKVLIPAWEEATGRRYFEYRQEIKEKCEIALRATGIPVNIGTDDIDWESDDEALIPIDDDDIVFPSVASIASRFTDNINLAIWRRVTNYLGEQRLENPAFGGQLDTCNWAIRKSFLKSFGYSDRVSILARHWHAAGILHPRLGGKPKPSDLLGRAIKATSFRTAGVMLKHSSIIELDEIHSVYYLHTGSISFLAHKIRDHVKDPVNYIRKLPLHPLLENHVPSRPASL